MNPISNLPPEVRELSQEAYQQWKHHPVTRALHYYLNDFAQKLKDDHADRWQGDALLGPENEAEARGRCAAIKEIEGLEASHIHDFYSLLADSPTTSEEKAAT